MSKRASGFREQPQAVFGAFEDRPRNSDGGRLKIGPGGRVVIPAELRDAMGVEEGDTLLATLVGDELRLVSIASAMAEARSIIREVIPPGAPSIVDELIADRRREQALEDERNK